MRASGKHFRQFTIRNDSYIDLVLLVKAIDATQG